MALVVIITNFEKVELMLIPIIGVNIWLLSSYLPKSLSFGRVLLAISALLLLQSLIRDVWLLIKQKHAEKTEAKTIMRCMCVESTVGLTGVVIGVVLLGSGLDQPVTINYWVWSTAAIAILLIGFVMKDYVMEFKPFRLRKNRHHQNIVVKWNN